jgi:V/A-type H+/Na+-transporting ATPase subunit D
MAKLNVPPTKSSLIQTKEQLSIAREGYDLLQQKRDILVMELMRLVEEVKLVEKDVDQCVERSYKSLKKMLFAVGRDRAREISNGIRFEYAVKERQMRIAGIPLPSLEIKMPDFDLRYSFMNTYAYCDRTMMDFFWYLTIVARLASIRTMVWRLAKEVKKTQRRVNALEKMVIPDTLETLVYIQSVLEEREREIFFVQKALKSRMEVRDEEPH